jgi:hypothetical protein
MNWKAEITSCAIAIALVTDVAAQSTSQLAETNRSNKLPTITGTR